MVKYNIMLRTLGVAGDEFLVVLFCFSSVSTWWSEIKVVVRVVMLLVLMILVLIRTGQSNVFHNLISVNAVEYNQGGEEDLVVDVDLDVGHDFENLDDEALQLK